MTGDPGWKQRARADSEHNPKVDRTGFPGDLIRGVRNTVRR